MERQDRKRFEINNRASMMSRYKNYQQIGLVKYYTLYGCGTCVARLDTIVLSEDYPGVFGKGNLPCNAKDNLRAGHLVIEAWFRGY